MRRDAAASAVGEFKPKFVYPYHCPGRNGGIRDANAFASAAGNVAEVRLVDWDPGNDSI